MWTICFKKRARPRLRLLCFPFAGGSALTFRTWADWLPEDLELHAVQLPGRHPRFDAPPLRSIGAIVGAGVPHFTALFDLPVAFFGHSMGAVVAFESARALAAQGRTIVHLAVSARVAPQLRSRRPQIHRLDDAKFIEALQAMKGTPDAVLADREMMDLMLPPLRADFTAIETYELIRSDPLACMISAFGGAEDDDVHVSELLAWQEQTTGMTLVETQPGGHFYIDENPRPMLATLTRDLAHY